MAVIRVSHDIPCSQAQFWALYADPDFQTTMLEDGLGYQRPQYSDVQDDGPVRTWTALVTPSLDLPPAVAKLLGGSMSYTETARIDRAASTMTLRHVTRALGNKLSLSGAIHTTESGEHALVRHSVFRVEAKVFGIGRLLERTVEDSVRQSLEATARFVSAHEHATEV
jgi:hypothetical protein